MVSIPACHAGDRGSIPRRGVFFNITMPVIRYKACSPRVETCKSVLMNAVDSINVTKCYESISNASLLWFLFRQQAKRGHVFREFVDSCAWRSTQLFNVKLWWSSGCKQNKSWIRQKCIFQNSELYPEDILVLWSWSFSIFADLASSCEKTHLFVSTFLISTLRPKKYFWETL